MLIQPTKVPWKVFSILFKILSTYCDVTNFEIHAIFALRLAELDCFSAKWMYLITFCSLMYGKESSYQSISTITVILEPKACPHSERGYSLELGLPWFSTLVPPVFIYGFVGHLTQCILTKITWKKIFVGHLKLRGGLKLTTTVMYKYLRCMMLDM